MPAWWINASGVFFILGSLAMIAMILLAIVLIHLALELKSQLASLNAKVETLTEKANSVAGQVQALTSDVTTRGQGLVRVMDDRANVAFEIIEKAAPVLVAVGMFLRLKALAGGKGRRRRG